jgi:hypothetical protein
MQKSLMRVAFIFVATLAACNSQSEMAEEQGQSVSATETQAAPGSVAGDPSVAHHPEPPARPAEKQDSMQMEGSWQRFSATLVQPTTDLPFSTYVPKDMIFEPASSGEGEGFFFYTNFSGRRNDNAFLLVFLLPRGSTRDHAQKLADAFAASRANDSQIARTQIGEYQGRFFYVAQTYPREYSEGFGPRAGFIRKQWIWLADGKSLDATL